MQRGVGDVNVFSTLESVPSSIPRIVLLFVLHRRDASSVTVGLSLTLNQTVIVFFYCALQEEHDQIRAKKKSSETLEWSDYKSMPFTQCVSIVKLCVCE